MEMMYYQLARSSCEDSLKVLEADIQHANALWVILFYSLVNLFVAYFVFYFSLFCFSFCLVGFFLFG